MSEKPPSTAVDRIEAVYRAEHDRLWRSLLGYTGNPDLASEAEAEAFAQAIRRGDAIEDPAAWIWRTAYRIAGGLLANRSAGPITMAEPPEQMANPVESLAETLNMLDDLSDQQRAVVTLRYVANLKPAEIADILGTSPVTIRVQLHRSHESLRTTWSQS